MTLSVRLGPDARPAFCEAFDEARSTIDAEFYSINDAAVVASLNRAAARGVRVRITVEGDPHRYRTRATQEPGDAEVRGGLDASVDVVVSRSPHALVHGKAAVIDGATALIATANITTTGFDAPGDAVVIDRRAVDARCVAAEIDAAASGALPRSPLRSELRSLYRSSADLRLASEDLSDWKTVAWLIHRARTGHHDRVLVGADASRSASCRMRMLVRAGVDVRVPRGGYMHEKFIDAGDRLYVGSANLTRNGIDESYEVGVVADASDFDDGAASLRNDFDERWNRARHLTHG